MSTTALSTAGRFPVRRKRPNRPALDNASRLVASVVRGPVQSTDGSSDTTGKDSMVHVKPNATRIGSKSVLCV